MYIPPNWGIFFALIVSFLAFWFIFRRLFFDPFLKVLSNRERKLKELGERAEQLIKEGRDADERRERELAALRREALAGREEERRKAEEHAARMIEQAKSEAHGSMELAREQIERQIASAESQIESLGRALGAELATRVLGRQLPNGAAARPDDEQ
jgi:F-type H+-transporting ATPase subunit b